MENVVLYENNKDADRTALWNIVEQHMIIIMRLAGDGVIEAPFAVVLQP
jgi:hypothetical protein